MASQKGLGKGLGALLGDFSEEPLEKSAYQQLPIYKVEPNPDQPRQDFDEEELQALADSIAVGVPRNADKALMAIRKCPTATIRSLPVSGAGVPPGWQT